MRALVVGYGSIGKRHTRILQEFGLDVAIVSQHSSQKEMESFSDLEIALQKWNPEYIVIANQTDNHYDSLRIIADKNFSGKVLVEKPLFDKVWSVPENNFSEIKIAYNLRFHPYIKRIKDLLAANDKSILTASIYVGSYLPEWRPNTDYSKGYSASKEKGGGVLSDLSHEIDYAHWFFGKWNRLTAIGGHFSDLNITSDDAFSILLETEKCPVVTIHLNYLDKKPYREILINTGKETIRVSLTENSIEVNGVREEINLDRDFTYQEQHRAMLSDKSQDLCDIQEGLLVLETIEAAKKANKSGIWIQR